MRAVLSVEGRTQFIARDKLELVHLKAERDLASLIEEVKIIINWLSEEDDELNQYRLRICYWVSWDRAVVIASNITLLPGNKIADLTPRIIRSVRNYFDLSPNQIMLVEHYPISSLHEELYLHVLCINNEAIRYEIDKNELMQLIAKPI